jgi:hypothetical protein
MRQRWWLFLTLSVFLSGEVRGEGRAAIESSASILSEFVHTCSPAQCETLRSIVAEDTASASERALAAALLRVFDRCLSAHPSRSLNGDAARTSSKAAVSGIDLAIVQRWVAAAPARVIPSF